MICTCLGNADLITKGSQLMLAAYSLTLCLDWLKGKEKKGEEEISIVWFQGWKGN